MFFFWLLFYYPLVMTNIAMVQMAQLQLIYLLKVVIFNSYVSLPEGKRQKFLLDFFRIAFCLQNRLSGNHETETAPNYSSRHVLIHPKYLKTFSLICFGLPKLSHHLSWFKFNQQLSQQVSLLVQIIPMHFLVQPNYPSRVFVLPSYFMFLSSAVTHRLVAIARVCSGMNMFEFGLGWASTGICFYPHGNNASKTLVG